MPSWSGWIPHLKRRKLEIVIAKKYKSKFERTVADIFKKKKIVAEYEPDKFNYTLDLTYTPDWKVTQGSAPTARAVYIETKGKFDYTERRKILGVLKSNPGIDLRMMFMRNNKLGKGSKMNYGEWCDKHEIKWSVSPELPL